MYDQSVCWEIEAARADSQRTNHSGSWDTIVIEKQTREKKEEKEEQEKQNTHIYEVRQLAYVPGSHPSPL